MNLVYDFGAKFPVNCTGDAFAPDYVGHHSEAKGQVQDPWGFRNCQFVGRFPPDAYQRKGWPGAIV